MRKFEEETVNSVLHTVASEDLLAQVANEMLIPDPDTQHDEEEEKTPSADS